MAVIRACNAFFSVEIETPYLKGCPNSEYSSFSIFPSGAFKNLIYMRQILSLQIYLIFRIYDWLHRQERLFA